MPMNTFDYKKVKDPQYFRDARMDAHSDHIYYRTKEEAEEKQSSYRVSLNGLWKFHYAKNYADVVAGFEKEDYCCVGWDDIKVPAHIQMEGYDVPQYANVQYPWEGHEDIHPGEIPEQFNPVASYVKYFTVPKQMQGKPNWRYRCLSGQRAAGARIRISSGFPESTAMYTCILCRKYMPMM